MGVSQSNTSVKTGDYIENWIEKVKAPHADVSITHNTYVHLLEYTKVKDIEKLENIDKMLA